MTQKKPNAPAVDARRFFEKAPIVRVQFPGLAEDLRAGALVATVNELTNESVLDKRRCGVFDSNDHGDDGAGSSGGVRT